jgi:hypothetical protein
VNQTLFAMPFREQGITLLLPPMGADSEKGYSSKNAMRLIFVKATRMIWLLPG